MIELKFITFRDADKIVLNGIDLVLKSQQKLVLTGPSGSGKSSIIKIIIGAMIPQAGIYKFEDTPVDAGNIHSVRSKIAFVGQEPILGGEIVLDALMLPFRYKQNKNLKPELKKVEELMTRLSLNPEILNQEVAKLSGGEKQRLAIIRALLLNKKLFLLDEVTSALDSLSKQAVIQELSKPEYTVLSVSHDPEWIKQCDKVLVVEKGMILESTSKSAGGNSGN